MMGNKKTIVKSPAFITQDLALDSYLATLLDEIPSTEILEKQEKQELPGRGKLSNTVQDKGVTPVKSRSINDDLALQSIKRKQRALISIAERRKKAGKVTADNVLQQSTVTEKVEYSKTVKSAGPVISSKKVNAIRNKKKAVNAVLEKNEDYFFPEYMQDDFLALFFKVGDTILAAPLLALLRAIQFNRDELSRIPSQPEWYLGMRTDAHNKIGVLNLHYLMHQEKERDKVAQYDSNSLHNIIITLDGEWGLACDEVMTISKIEKDKVRWRQDRERTPWMMGNVIDGLAIVVDIDKFIPDKANKAILRKY